jgi:hypothetical protein
MKLSDEELIQAFTDAIGGLAVALSKQVDPRKLANDLKTLAKEADDGGQRGSASLLMEIGKTVESRI